MNIDEKIKEVENHLHNLYEDADKTYTRPEDADMVIEVTAKQLKEYENVLTELKKYKDMEAVGKLVKLNCKVGDTVYVDATILPVEDMERYEDTDREIPTYFQARVVSFRFAKRNWMKIAVREKWLYEWIDDETGPDSNYIECEKNFAIPLSGIGKSVFLTESEAEMKLKELKCSISGRCKENKDIEDIER